VSAAVGLLLVLLLFSLTESNRVGQFANLLLLPGAALAELGGRGAHDVAGLLLYIVGNVVFYAAGLMVVFLLFRYRKTSAGDRL